KYLECEPSDPWKLGGYAGAAIGFFLCVFVVARVSDFLAVMFLGQIVFWGTGIGGACLASWLFQLSRRIPDARRRRRAATAIIALMTLALIIGLAGTIGMLAAKRVQADREAAKQREAWRLVPLGSGSQ